MTEWQIITAGSAICLIIIVLALVAIHQINRATALERQLKAVEHHSQELLERKAHALESWLRSSRRIYYARAQVTPKANATVKRMDKILSGGIETPATQYVPSNLGAHKGAIFNVSV